MIRFFKVSFIFIMSLAIFSCNKNDDDSVAPYIVPHAEQYPRDLAAIEAYLKTHTMSVIDHEGFPDDRDVTFATVAAGDANSIWGALSTPKSSLLSKTVNSNGVDYKVYYVNITDDSDPTSFGDGEKPTIIDSVFVSYKGSLLNEAVFDQAQNHVGFSLNGVIRGWKEIIPLFKSGVRDTTTDPNNPTYPGFGAGVMFLPSGLGYYNGSNELIPSYSPLIFSFKLKDVNYVDHDGDRIDSVNEDVNGDGDPTNDDSDGDGFVNALDIDDDGDGISTKNEIKFTYIDSEGATKTGYYPYTGAVVDDTETPYDDTKGIPDCSGDYYTPTRLRKHLDKNCQ